MRAIKQTVATSTTITSTTNYYLLADANRPYGSIKIQLKKKPKKKTKTKTTKRRKMCEAFATDHRHIL